jgi:hypothetical protein
VKDAVGSATGDTKTQAEGKMDKAKGSAQSAMGGAKDAAATRPTRARPDPPTFAAAGSAIRPAAATARRRGERQARRLAARSPSTPRRNRPCPASHACCC